MSNDPTEDLVGCGCMIVALFGTPALLASFYLWIRWLWQMVQ